MYNPSNGQYVHNRIPNRLNPQHVPQSGAFPPSAVNHPANANPINRKRQPNPDILPPVHQKQMRPVMHPQVFSRQPMPFAGNAPGFPMMNAHYDNYAYNVPTIDYSNYQPVNYAVPTYDQHAYDVSTQMENSNAFDNYAYGNPADSYYAEAPIDGQHNVASSYSDNYRVDTQFSRSEMPASITSKIPESKLSTKTSSEAASAPHVQKPTVNSELQQMNMLATAQLKNELNVIKDMGLPYVHRLAEEEMKKLGENLNPDWLCFDRVLITLQKRLLIPSPRSGSYIIGRLLGKGGTNLKQICNTFRCRLAIMGSGSSRDRANELELLKTGDEKHKHFGEPLHLLILMTADSATVYERFGKVLKLIQRIVSSNETFEQDGIRVEAQVKSSSTKDGQESLMQLNVPNAIGQEKVESNDAKQALNQNKNHEQDNAEKPLVKTELAGQGDAQKAL